MNIRNFLLLMVVSILMVSTKAMSDECVAGSNYFLPAGDSYTIYNDLHLTYDNELTVCVTSNFGAAVRIEDGDGQELFTVEGNSGCGQFQDVDTVRAICEGVGSNDCNINWNICGQSPEFAIPDQPTTRPTDIDDVAIEENNNKHPIILNNIVSSKGESSLVKGGSRIDSFKVEPCPEGTVLTPFEMPVYDEQGIFVVGYKRVYYCIPENTPIPR